MNNHPYLLLECASVKRPVLTIIAMFDGSLTLERVAEKIKERFPVEEGLKCILVKETGLCSIAYSKEHDEWMGELLPTQDRVC